MVMMNWRSAGVKVLSITLAALAIMVICLLFFSYSHSKQKSIEQSIQTAKKIMQFSESTQSITAKRWTQGLMNVQLLSQLIANRNISTAKLIVATHLPTLAGATVLEETSKKEGFDFKTLSIFPNKQKSTQNPIEDEALSFFNNNATATEFSYIDEEKQTLHYFKPIKLEKPCGQCQEGSNNLDQHLWEKINALDTLGFGKENKRTGDLLGAFEIIIPMTDGFATVMNDLIWQIGFFFVLLLITTVTGYITMSNVIITPLTDLALKLQDISGGDGDLTVRLKAKGGSEFAWVAYSFNTFVKKIAKTINNISATSEQLSTSAHKLAEISVQTEAGVTQQLQETTQVATAMEEMTATVQEVALNAVNASNSAVTADTEAASGKGIVNNTVDAINQLASEVENAASVIHELENDSNSIGEVLSVIQGIAEQTNLLALNAAIEAARAGEQGRGFAVVADEVRTLASRTQNSTLEIQQTIERLQNRAKEAVSVMDNGKKQAATSVDQAASAGKSITNISERIDTISDMNNQIAAAAEEQKVVAEEINRNINNISSVSSETLIGAKSTSESCQGLSELADQLRKTVGQFKT